MTPQPTTPPGKQGLPTPLLIVIVLVVGFSACSCLGILAAIAIPNFLKFQARSKQAECKTELKAAFTAEKSYFAEHDVFTADAKLADIDPTGPRSVLVLAPPATVGRGPDAEGLAAAILAHVSGPVGVTGQCPDCNITIGCGANIDQDANVDVWSISTGDRTSARGGLIPAGIPYNDYNDMTGKPGD